MVLEYRQVFRTMMKMRDKVVGVNVRLITSSYYTDVSVTNNEDYYNNVIRKV